MLLYKIVLSHELLCLGCICIDVSDSDTRIYMSDTGILVQSHDKLFSLTNCTRSSKYLPSDKILMLVTEVTNLNLLELDELVMLLLCFTLFIIYIDAKYPSTQILMLSGLLNSCILDSAATPPHPNSCCLGQQRVLYMYLYHLSFKYKIASVD